jgi:hypothetical protein
VSALARSERKEWPAVGKVLAQDPQVMIDYFRDLTNAFIVGRARMGDRWLSMPFPAYAPTVREMATTLSKLQAQLIAWGHPADAALGDEVKKNIERIQNAGHPYLATNLLGWHFANFACVYDTIASQREKKPYPQAEPVAQSRVRAKKAGLSLRFALEGRLLGTSADAAALARAMAKTGAATKMIIDDYFYSYQTPKTDPNMSALEGASQLLRRWDGLLGRLESTGAKGFVGHLEPALSLLVRCCETTRIDPKTGKISMDKGAWTELARLTERALDRLPISWEGHFGGHPDGLLELLPVVTSGRKVPLWMFGKMPEADIGAAFVTRIAPFGLVTRRDPGENWDPAGFVLHDAGHTTTYATRFTSIEEWSKNEAEPLRRALPPFLRSVGRYDESFFGLVHEANKPATDDPRFRRFLS